MENSRTTRAECPYCRANHRRKQELRKIRHYENKRYTAALKAGIESGKVIKIWHRDPFTGWHYMDYKGYQKLTGFGGL